MIYDGIPQYHQGPGPNFFDPKNQPATGLFIGPGSEQTATISNPKSKPEPKIVQFWSRQKKSII